MYYGRLEASLWVPLGPLQNLFTRGAFMKALLFKAPVAKSFPEALGALLKALLVKAPLGKVFCRAPKGFAKALLVKPL